MAVTSSVFGVMPDSKEVKEYTIENRNGVKAVILTLGATLARLYAPDRNGEFKDILLGFDTLEGYLTLWDYQGAVVGPCANRIGGASFTVDGEKFNVTANEKGITCLHSAGEFNNAVWNAGQTGDNEVTFTYRSPDKTNGFPGNTDVSVTYILTDDNALHIKYEAVSDKKTPLNITNHAYFNLKGYDGGTILDHTLKLNCSAFTPVDKDSIPTGEIRNVKGTAFAFTSPTKIGNHIEDDDEQLIFTGGFDHNFCIDGWDKTLQKAAEVYEETSGRTLEVFTDLPGVQFYAGNFLKGDCGKNGIPMERRSGFCLETQYYPDSVNKPQFPSCIFEPGEKFISETIFKVSAK